MPKKYHKVVLVWPSEARITYTLEANSEAEYAKRLDELVRFGDTDGCVEIHRIDEVTGADAEVVVDEPVHA
ncbi:MAG: hypothetical protein EBS91_00105 [Betaproteobacteria bacterium]|nr:hypothetical protein [Betaproteobacteria bacterium]NCA23038.1 hypothetical protein [Betaproteobacteria bacterium]